MSKGDMKNKNTTDRHNQTQNQNSFDRKSPISKGKEDKTTEYIKNQPPIDMENLTSSEKGIAGVKNKMLNDSMTPKIETKPEKDEGKIKVYGPGLHRGYLQKENTFSIETRSAGTGGIGLSIEGPGDVDMRFKDNKNGSGTVHYIPDEEGTYIIIVTFNGSEIPESPFEALITST